MNKPIQSIIVGPTNVGKTSLLEQLQKNHAITPISIGAFTRQGGIDGEIQ